MATPTAVVRDRNNDPLVFADAIMVRIRGMERHKQGRHGEALELFEQASTAFRRCAAEVQVGWTLQNEGLVLEQLGRAEDALNRFAEAERLFRTHGDGAGSTLMQRRRGDLWRRRGDQPQAVRSYDQGIADYTAAHDVNGVANTLSGRAASHLLAGRAADALADLEQARARLATFLRKPGEQDFLMHYRLGQAHHLLGAASPAQAHRATAQLLVREAGLVDDHTNPDVIAAIAALR